jgi:hypothetical protein
MPRAGVVFSGMGQRACGVGWCAHTPLSLLDKQLRAPTDATESPISHKKYRLVGVYENEKVFGLPMRKKRNQIAGAGDKRQHSMYFRESLFLFLAGAERPAPVMTLVFRSSRRFPPVYVLYTEKGYKLDSPSGTSLHPNLWQVRWGSCLRTECR